MKKIKFYWHIHHDVLVEPLTEPLKNRINFIKKEKPKSEIKLRLKLLKPVKGKLPEKLIKAWRAYDEARRACDEVWSAYVEAERACGEAKRACDEAWSACDEVWSAYVEARRACDEAWRAYGEAKRAYDEAWRAYDEAWRAYGEAGRAYEKEINSLHKKECPNCPWDGESIFK